MGGFIYWSTIGFMDRQTNAVIETDIEGLADVYRRDGLRGLIDTIESRINRDPERSSIYLVTDHRKTPVVGNISAWPNAGPDETGWIEFRLKDPAAGRTTRARVRPFLLPGGVNILVGRDVRKLEDVKLLIERSLLWAMIIASIVGISAGLLITRRVGRRLETISEMSRGVIQGDMSRRVPIHGGEDDLDQLGRGLNTMLDEIQQLLSGIEHVTDNIAHDLRTPLSRLRNRLVALRDSVSERSEVTTSLDICLTELDQLLATFSAILRITKLEASGPGRHADIVHLNEVVGAAIDLYEPVGSEKGISIQSQLEDVAILADRDLVLQAICNLLDNAIKFSVEHGRVDVDLRGDEAAVWLRIADHGIGISGDDRDKVFDRFYQGQLARTIDGSGLGLSMVKAILNHHGASISLEDNYPGLRVKVKFQKS
ncbi:MAG: signal transduction histidine kinase [Gammaproteobacteria bacterium]|jgi:signal transduction histidine kinase